MKTCIYITFISFLIISCNNKNERNLTTNKTGTIVCSDSLNIEKQPEHIDMFSFKKKCDSILSIIFSRELQTNMTIDSVFPEGCLFLELQNTQVENITEQTLSCIKHSYSFIYEDGFEFIHHLIILEFTTTEETNSAYTLFEEVSTNKCDGPGLTYSNDYLFPKQCRIYWLNSCCSYSYSNHMELVNVLKQLTNYRNKKCIKCACGEVKCILN